MRYQPSTIRDNVLHDISEGVLVVDMDGIVALYNPACARILEIPFEKAKERHCGEAFKENPEFVLLLTRAIHGIKHKHILEYQIGSSHKHLFVRSSPLRENEQTVGIIFVINDDTELLDLKENIADMEKQKKKVEHRIYRLEGRNNKLAKTFAKYTSDAILNTVLDQNNGADFSGKKAHLTVLMTDLRGFSAISEFLSPQDLLKLLNHYFGEMTEITSAYDGTIIDFTGDGMLVLFGAPIDHIHHAELATAAAIAMQQKMADVNIWNTDHHLPNLEMGIGIATGDMVLGNIGSDRHAKYGVVGNQVNLCSRIESYTVGGEIYISPQTKEEIRPPLNIIKEKIVRPKGLNAPITIYHVNELGDPYNVTCPGIPNPPTELSQPLEISFTVCNDKHCDIIQKMGMITHMNRQSARMLTQMDELNNFDEILLDIGDNLGCRVVDKTANCYLLRFTSIPSNFDEWYETTVKTHM